jgi:nucleoid DNA-binding protein
MEHIANLKQLRELGQLYRLDVVKSRQVYNAICNTIIELILEQGKVSIPLLGTFFTVSRALREVDVPKAIAPVITKGMVIVKFEASKEMMLKIKQADPKLAPAKKRWIGSDVKGRKRLAKAKPTQE